MCSQHITAHANECDSHPQFIGKTLIKQAAEVSDAISHLKELRAKVWENSENLIQIIHQTSRIIISMLESKQQMLDEIQFGTAWDATKIESIKGLNIEEISLENFTSTIGEIVKFKEVLLSNKKFHAAPVAVISKPEQNISASPLNVIAIPKPTPEIPVSSSVVPLKQKKQQARRIGVAIDYTNEDTEEILFTNDGKFVFSCKAYADGKFYKGIRYADSRSYAECRS